MDVAYQLLRRFTDIRPDEAEPALHLFLYFFLITFSIYIVKPVKENFLIGIAPAWWPYAEFHHCRFDRLRRRLQHHAPQRCAPQNYFSWVAVFFVLNLIMLWFIFEIKVRGSAPALSGMSLLIETLAGPVFVFSFWSDIFIVMSVTHFWLTVNDVFNPRQAKSMVSFFVTGGLLGGIAGSLLTSRLVHALGPVNLLLVCPGILLLTLIIVNPPLFGAQKPMADVEAGQKRTQVIWKACEPFAGIDIFGFWQAPLQSAIIVGTLINYQFKIAVKANSR